MASFKALCLAGVASLAVTATASAADLLPPPPQFVPPPPPPAPVDFGGWYLRGDVGAAISDLDQRSSIFKTNVPNPIIQEANLRTTAFVDAGVGYRFNQWFRADITGEYHFGSRYTGIQSYDKCGSFTGRCYDGYNANISSAVFLANGYVDLGTWYGVTPYVGGGVGVANTWVKKLTDYDLGGNGGYGVAGDSSSTHFAYALMAGLSYNLTANLALDFGYRYLDMGTVTSNAIVCTAGCTYERQRYHLAEHDLRVGVRYTFADLLPYAQPQLPLIRKY